MTTDRREFLKTSSVTALGAMACQGLPAWKRRSGTSNEDPILVVVQLSGGNDGINTVVPFRDPGYAENRTTLRLPATELLKIDQQTALHPALEPCMKMLDDGRMSIVQGVGYPKSDRSHFRSLAIWHHARINALDHNGIGWIGRVLDRQKRKPGQDSPAIFIGAGTVPSAIRGTRAAATSIDRIEDFMLPRGSDPRALLGSQAKAKAKANRPSATALHSYIEQSLHAACRTADRVKTVVKSGQRSSPYPGYALARKLRLVSQLMKIGHGAKVYYTDQGSYDTHAGQLGTHSGLLRELARSLSAFMEDLKASKLDDRVTVLVFSEFGRTLSENASSGTDHGSAAPVLILGKKLQTPLLGKAPSLQELEDGEPIPTTDFRRIYAALAKHCLHADPSTLFPGFAPLPLF